MSLNWSLNKVKDYKTACYHPEKDGGGMKSATECLIWALMAIGISKVTKKNCQDLYLRLRFYESLFGAFRRNAKTGAPVMFEFPEIVAHIGLETNVSDETEAKWMKRTIMNFNRENRIVDWEVPS